MRKLSYRGRMLDDLDDIHPLFHGAPSSTEFRKLRKRIVREVREAIETYGMIARGARWLVCRRAAKTAIRCSPP